jgi:hypothetical protein
MGDEFVVKGFWRGRGEEGGRERLWWWGEEGNTPDCL